VNKTAPCKRPQLFPIGPERKTGKDELKNIWVTGASLAARDEEEAGRVKRGYALKPGKKIPGGTRSVSDTEIMPNG